MLALKERLNIPKKEKPSKFWKDPSVIESEVQKFLEVGGSLTRRNFQDQKASGLEAAIRKYYPGGMTALKKKLGILPTAGISLSPEEANVAIEELAKELDNH